MNRRELLLGLGALGVGGGVPGLAWAGEDPLAAARERLRRAGLPGEALHHTLELLEALGAARLAPEDPARLAALEAAGARLAPGLQALRAWVRRLSRPARRGLGRALRAACAADGRLPGVEALVRGRPHAHAALRALGGALSEALRGRPVAAWAAGLDPTPGEQGRAGQADPGAEPSTTPHGAGVSPAVNRRFGRILVLLGLACGLAALPLALLWLPTLSMALLVLGVVWVAVGIGVLVTTARHDPARASGEALEAEQELLALGLALSPV